MCAAPAKAASVCRLSCRSRAGIPLSQCCEFFDFHSEDGPKGDWRGRQLHDLDDEVGNVAVGIVRRTALWADYVAFGGGKEDGEDGIPRPIPYILGGRGGAWCSTLVLYGSRCQRACYDAVDSCERQI